MNGIKALLSVCGQELRKNIKDSGVLVFFLIVPLLYPLLYAYLYGGEVVREVPIVAVDMNRTPISREFLRKADATPDLKIISYCSDMEEARTLLKRHKAYGIVLVPDDFSSLLAQGHQATIGAYCDMSGLLYYKAMLSGTTLVSLEMNRDIQMERLAGLTDRQLEVQTMPVENEYITMFNPANGFQSFLIPAILILIIQQTMVLGVCMMAGTEYELRKKGQLLLGREYKNPLLVLFGKALAYCIVYAFMSVYLLMLVPHLFHMPQLANQPTLVAFMVPFLLACVFFSIFLSFFVRDRESGFLMFVFVSVPMIFMSGISWPVSNMPWFWHSLAQLFPSTHGINGFCRIIGNGALLGDIRGEYMMLWVLAGIYFLCSLSAFLLFYRSSHIPGIEYVREMRRRRREKLEGRLDSVEDKLKERRADLQELRQDLKDRFKGGRG